MHTHCGTAKINSKQGVKNLTTSHVFHHQWFTVLSPVFKNHSWTYVSGLRWSSWSCLTPPCTWSTCASRKQTTQKTTHSVLSSCWCRLLDCPSSRIMLLPHWRWVWTANSVHRSTTVVVLLASRGMFLSSVTKDTLLCSDPLDLLHLLGGSSDHAPTLHDHQNRWSRDHHHPLPLLPGPVQSALHRQLGVALQHGGLRWPDRGCVRSRSDHFLLRFLLPLRHKRWENKFLHWGFKYYLFFKTKQTKTLVLPNKKRDDLSIKIFVKKRL